MFLTFFVKYSYHYYLLCIVLGMIVYDHKKKPPNSPNLYGAKAAVNMWDPALEGDEMSISQIWISSGKYESNDLNTISWLAG